MDLNPQIAEKMASGQSAPDPSGTTEGRGTYDHKLPELPPDHISAFDYYNEYAIKEDREREQEWLQSMDTILIFSGLFAAFLGAFIVDMTNKLQPDPQELTNALLYYIILQNRNSSIELFEFPTQQVDNKLSVINALFYSALSLVLVSAFVAMLIKGWIREFDRGLSRLTDAKARAIERERRLRGLEDWKLPEIVSALPFLVYLAFGCFFTGLIIFLFTLHLPSALLTLILASFGVLVYFGTAFISTVDQSAPFPSPLSRVLQPIAKRLQRQVSRTPQFDAIELENKPHVLTRLIRVTNTSSYNARIYRSLLIQLNDYSLDCDLFRHLFSSVIYQTDFVGEQILKVSSLAELRSLSRQYAGKYGIGLTDSISDKIRVRMIDTGSDWDKILVHLVNLNQSRTDLCPDYHDILLNSLSELTVGDFTASQACFLMDYILDHRCKQASVSPINIHRAYELFLYQMVHIPAFLRSEQRLDSEFQACLGLLHRIWVNLLKEIAPEEPMLDVFTPSSTSFDFVNAPSTASYQTEVAITNAINVLPKVAASLSTVYDNQVPSDIHKILIYSFWCLRNLLDEWPRVGLLSLKKSFIGDSTKLLAPGDNTNQSGTTFALASLLLHHNSRGDRNLDMAYVSQVFERAFAVNTLPSNEILATRWTLIQKLWKTSRPSVGERNTLLAVAFLRPKNDGSYLGIEWMDEVAEKLYDEAGKLQPSKLGVFGDIQTYPGFLIRFLKYLVESIGPDLDSQLAVAIRRSKALKVANNGTGIWFNDDRKVLEKLLNDCAKVRKAIA